MSTRWYLIVSVVAGIYCTISMLGRSGSYVEALNTATWASAFWMLGKRSGEKSNHD